MGYGGVLKKVKTQRLSTDSKDAIEALVPLYESADPATINDAEKLFKSALAKMQVKVEKDIKVMLEIQRPDNFVLPMTNRSNVSFHFLSIEFNNMVSGALICYTQAA